MKDCLADSFLGLKLMMSLGQNAPPYTYSRQRTGHFVSQAVIGKICRKFTRIHFECLYRNFNHSPNSFEIRFTRQDLCSKMQDYKTYIDERTEKI